jgi:hypothetical protein
MSKKKIIYGKLIESNKGFYKTAELKGFLPLHHDPSEVVTCKDCAYSLGRDGAKGREYYCCHKELRNKSSKNSFKTIIGKHVNRPIKISEGFVMENNVMGFFPACPLAEITERTK